MLLNEYDDVSVSQEAMLNESNWTLLKSSLHPDLIKAFTTLKSDYSPRNFYRDSRAKALITDAIKKATNITVEIDREYKFFAMMPPDINKNHVLTLDVHKFYYNNEEIKAKQRKLRASVDLKNFRVGGDFAEIPVKLFLDPSLIWSNHMTASELSAVVIHEVGHMFSYFALAAHAYSINLPLLGTLNKLAKSESTENIQMILRDWNDHDTTMTQVNVEELSGKKKEIIVTALISNQVNDTRSLMKQREYEDVNAEHLADKFAVRCGAGKDLVTGLDKLFMLYGSRQKSVGNLIAQELLIGVLLALTAAIIVTTMPTIIVPLFIGIPAFFEILGTSSNAGDGRYDTEKHRIERIREDMVVMLKNQDIDKAIGQRLRDDIARIDQILKTYHEYKSLFGLFADFILPSKRRLLSQTEYYRELEKLSANTLFIGAYDLNNLK